MDHSRDGLRLITSNGKRVFKGTHHLRKIMQFIEEIEDERDARFADEVIEEAIQFTGNFDGCEQGMFNAPILKATLKACEAMYFTQPR